MTDIKVPRKKLTISKTVFLRNEFPGLDDLYGRLDALNQIIESSNASKDECGALIEWFDRFDAAGVRSRLEATTEQIRSLNAELTQVSDEQRALTGRIQELVFKASPGRDPRYWFSSQRTSHKQLLDEAVEQKRMLDNKYKNLEADLKPLHTVLQKIRKTFEEYEAFDLSAATKKRAELDETISDAAVQVKFLEASKILVEEKIQQPHAELQSMRKEKNALKQQIACAALYESELEQTGDARSRARIYARCENELGSSRPHEVIRRLQARLRMLDTGLEKLHTQIAEDVRLALVTVTALVIDGNNLCYQAGRFIGLSALRAIVPVLACRYKVIIIFDAGIRYQLRMNDYGLAEVFGENIEIFVVSDGIKADETVLNVAGQDPTFYVLSNDRFIDFPSRDAVLGRRIFRHQIVSDAIHVSQLNISEKFK